MIDTIYPHLAVSPDLGIQEDGTFCSLLECKTMLNYFVVYCNVRQCGASSFQDMGVQEEGTLCSLLECKTMLSQVALAVSPKMGVQEDGICCSLLECTMLSYLALAVSPDMGIQEDGTICSLLECTTMFSQMVQEYCCCRMSC